MPRTAVWRYGSIGNLSEAPFASGDIWGFDSSQFLIAMITGDTLLRVRVNWHLGFGLYTKQAATQPPAKFWWHDSRIFLGIWGDKTASTGTGPPSPDDTAEHPGWVQWGIATPTQIRDSIMKNGDEVQEAIYTFNFDVSDSKGRRGPWQTSGGLWAAWSFASTFEYWTTNTANQFGYIGGSLGIEALVLQAS